MHGIATRRSLPFNILTSIDMMRPPPRHVLSPIAVEGLQQPRRQENPLMEGGVLEEWGARTAMNCWNCLVGFQGKSCFRFVGS